MKHGGLFACAILWLFGFFLVVNSNDDGAVTVVEEEDYDTTNSGPVKVGIDHTGKGSKDSKPFVATSEWKKVEKGQSIPKGLHVRMNIQTNEIEAKLLEPSEESEQDLVRKERKRQMVDIQESAAAFENRDQIRLSRQQIKEVLKNMKHDQDDVQDDTIREEALKAKFRSMDELRAEMKEMEMNVKTDMEIIRQLWDRYTTDTITENERVSILQDLEYYLHQYDNAQNFAKMGGLEVLNVHLNSSSSAIRQEVALVVASAVQSNPGVQVKAIEAGLMHHLIRLIANEEDLTVKTRVVGAAASLVRRFPYAQKKFLQLGGLDALSALFQSPGQERLQLKAVTLLGDLLNELNETEDHPDPMIARDNYLEKLRQYREVGLLDALSGERWCRQISSLLTLPDHDAREKVLTTMFAVLDMCHAHFRNQITHLETLLREYETLSNAGTNSESKDEYFTQLHQSVHNVLSKIRTSKDEL